MPCPSPTCETCGGACAWPLESIHCADCAEYVRPGYCGACDEEVQMAYDHDTQCEVCQPIYACPWCEYVTDSERDLVRHLAMAPASHAVLNSWQNRRLK